MAETASDVLVDRLVDWGVNVIFGIPGDGINGVIEALRKRKDDIRFVQTRHEEAAAFMACAYAKYTGRLGVCLATTGPGGVHLLNGLYDAKMDGQPVLAITGVPFHDLINTHTQQDIELDKLFEDVTVYNVRIMGAAHVNNAVDLACRTALGYRGVAHVTIPVDVQSTEAAKDIRSKRNVPGHNTDVFTRKMGLPHEDDLKQAAAIINEGKKVLILAGRGALGCADELEELAARLGAPVAKPLLGKGVLPDESPYTTGSIGLLGTKPSQQAMEECDTLLMIGTSFPYIEFLPQPGQARGVQIDIDPARIGLRFPVEVGLVGDSRETLRRLLPLVEQKGDLSFLKTAQDRMKDWWKLMEERGTRSDVPMKPQVVAHELSKLIDDDALVSCDSGTIATWWARHIKVRKGQMHTLSGTLATMACGMPYAIGGAVAYPGRQSIAFVGDGGFTMLMGEFATAVKYHLPLKVIIIKNNVLGQIKWEQMVFLGNPEYEVELQPIDFAKYAEACGGRGYTIEDPAECADTLREALAHDGPVVVQCVVDPFEPPMPPMIKPEQALHFAESLARGEPNREKIALTVASDKVRELV